MKDKLIGKMVVVRVNNRNLVVKVEVRVGLGVPRYPQAEIFKIIVVYLNII